MKTLFEWDNKKDHANREKHGVSFALAQHAFLDPCRVVAKDLKHSKAENRYYCVGKAGEGILTVRFTHRKGIIRIIGAGYWRKGKELYEKENKEKS
ncbi:MAG: BrnT family toxin [Nitrospinales bacterium]